MDCVLDSDEEGHHASRLRCAAAPASSSFDDEIVSDGEPQEPAWSRWEQPVAPALRQLNALLPPAASMHQQQQTGDKAFARSSLIRPPTAKPPASNYSAVGGFRRQMKTTAAAEAERCIAERAAAEAVELLQASQAGGEFDGLQADKSLSLQPLSMQQGEQQPSTIPFQPRGQSAGGQVPAFLNRQVLPRPPSAAGQVGHQPRPSTSVTAIMTGAAAAPSTEGHVSSSEQQHPKQQLLPAARQRLPSAIPPAGPQTQVAGTQHAVATLRRTSDGLNVVYLNRRSQQQTDAGLGQGGSHDKDKAENVNSGWGNNFVRMDLKKGRGSTKYGTKHGSKLRKRSGGRGSSRWQAPRMRQVGDGADFIEGWKDSRMRCFKCGARGHFAKDCTAAQQVQAAMGASESSSDNDTTTCSTRKQAVAGSSQLGMPAAVYQHSQEVGAGAGASCAGSQDARGSLRVLSLARAPVAQAATSIQDPATQYAAVLGDPTEVALTSVLTGVFGHSAFRGLQLATVQQLLNGESLLSIMPTGMGKSLCYQLPALLLRGLTLVVSPLIALMHDQAASVPPPLTAAVLWSGQSRADAVQVLADVAAGRVKVLFVSPERLNNPHLLEALQPCMPLPLVVVDEAHCVAEWGHSFRPAYFRLGAALSSDVQAQRILALTATATRATEAAIRQVLRIPPTNVLRDAAVRPNLRLQVLRTAGGCSSQATYNRICGLFKACGSLHSVRSAIVYCSFKEDANQLARMLASQGINARAYHAGKDYRERSAIEADFAAGRVRVVVATVAFGMGINLASVGAVVHACMPRSLEEYVQQIGRAGRDGSEATCIALLDDGDFVRLRSLAFSGVLDLPAVQRFLEIVFSAAAEGQTRLRRGSSAVAKKKVVAAAVGHNTGKKRKAADEASEAVDAGSLAAGDADAAEGLQEPFNSSLPQQGRAAEAEAHLEPGLSSWPPTQPPAQSPTERRFGMLAIKKLAAELDMREDAMESVLSYLEAEEQPCLRMLPTTALSVKVSFYAAAAQQLELQYPVVKAVLAACPNPRNGVYSAPTAKLARAAQKAPGLVLQQLRELAAGNLIGFELSRDEGLAYEILQDPPSLDSLAKQVHARLALVLGCQVKRLDESYRALLAAVNAGNIAEANGQQQQQESALRAAAELYFEAEAGSSLLQQPRAAAGAAAGAVPANQCSSGSQPLLLNTTGLPLKQAEPSLLGAARAVLRRNQEQAGPELSARALARILHGVGSPAFPSDAWHKRMGAFWGSQAHIDFAAVLKAAEIVVRSGAA